jgi:uncharacterized protein (TIGR03435 family)
VRYSVTRHAVLVTILAALFLSGPRLQGQGAHTAEQKPPTFDVASVKVNLSGERRAWLRLLQPNGFVATNAPLTMLVASFYRVPIFRVVGGPEWIHSERFDITATSGSRISTDGKRAMGRTLLETRFKLQTHRETRDGRIYALVVAREDGRLGPGLTPSSLNCSAIPTHRSSGGRLNRFDIWENGPPPCIAVASRRRVQGDGIQISALASTLGTMVRETVVDRTGLTGSFRVDLVVMRNATTPDSPESTPRTERILTALREQLGLRLEPTTGPVEVLVIDHAEKPTPD